jgi:predicted DNA-binding transcriptional regulator AlpA
MQIDTPNADALLLSGPDVSRRLGIGISHLHGLRRAGQLPLTPIRLGRAVRFRADELARWVAAGCPAAAKWEAMNAGKRGAA